MGRGSLSLCQVFVFQRGGVGCLTLGWCVGCGGAAPSPRKGEPDGSPLESLPYLAWYPAVTMGFRWGRYPIVMPIPKCHRLCSSAPSLLRRCACGPPTPGC